MKFWENFSSFELANQAWDKKQALLENKKPLKKVLFDPRIKISFSNFTRIKSLLYLLQKDKKLKLIKFFIKKPLFYLHNLLKSYFSKAPYIVEDNVFLFNLSNFKELKKITDNKDNLFIFGLSYCQKPIECPKKRFSSECIHDYENDICAQCFIGKCSNAINNNDIILVIPDIYFFSETIIELINKNPEKQIIFVISACELSIKMYSDLANMLKIKGLGLKLSSRVCTNFKSFTYAEKGQKNSVTDLNLCNKELMIEIMKIRSEI